MTIKNICINIGLLIVSAILYIFYEKYFTELYINRWPSIFLGVIIIFIIIFSNAIGLLLSIIKIQTTVFTIVNYVLLIISTILIYNIINIIVKTLENKNIISECSSILFIGIIIVLENIISNYIVKIIKKCENKIRGNFA
jgi:quinol-cytochrome oxidoreductase complex cytochrome b subunit